MFTFFKKMKKACKLASKNALSCDSINVHREEKLEQMKKAHNKFLDEYNESHEWISNVKKSIENTKR